MRRRDRGVRANARGDGDRARRAVQCRGRLVAGQDTLGAGEMGGPDDDQLRSVSLDDNTQSVGGRAIGNRERAAPHADTGQLGLDAGQDVFVEQRRGRAGVHRDELAPPVACSRAASASASRPPSRQSTPTTMRVNITSSLEVDTASTLRQGIDAAIRDRPRRIAGKPPRETT
jgi:hypothetical protein